jgi:hypothetical protein
MHKKRAVIVSVMVLIVILSTIIIASEYDYYKNSQLFLNAIKEIRNDSEKGFEMCGQITMEDFASDCYATYLSVEIEAIKADYPDYETMEGQEKKDAAIDILNRISEKVERVCSIDVMQENSETCLQVQSVIELQKEKVLSS